MLVRRVFSWLIIAIALVALGLLLARLTPALGQERTFRIVPSEQRREIHVVGLAERWTDPDRCRIYVGCESQDPNLSTARSLNNKRVSGVMEALRRLKIPNLKMKAPSLNVELIYADTGRREPPRILAYRVTQNFTVLLSNNDPEALSQAAGKVIDAALTHGANRLYRVQFFKEREAEKKIQDELLAEAVKDALSKARRMAAAAGTSIANIVRLSVTRAYYPVHRTELMQAAGPEPAAGPATSVLYGRVKIACAVDLTASLR